MNNERETPFKFRMVDGHTPTVEVEIPYLTPACLSGVEMDAIYAKVREMGGTCVRFESAIHHGFLGTYLVGT